MADPKAVLRSATRSGRRILVAVAGFTVLALGLVLSIPAVPGPGIAVVLAGLAILATEFPWARRLLHRVRGYARQTAQKVRDRRARSRGGLPRQPIGGGDRAA